MISESTASREAALSGRLTFLNTGSGTNAEVRIYGGTQPVNANTASSETMLVAIKLDNPAGTVGSGVLTLDPLESGMVSNTGYATWARVVNKNGAVAFDMSAGVDGSGAECILSNDQLYAGGLVAITSAVLG